jgi:tetratricopeptide (TPR) repeat protein
VAFRLHHTYEEIAMFHGTDRLATAIAVAMIAAGAWAADGYLITQGAKQWEQGRLDEARQSFEQAVAADPRSIETRMKLGGLQLASRSYTAAIQTYQQVLGLDGNNAKAWIGMGFAYLHSGQQELSRAAFAEAIRVEPGRKAQLAPLASGPAE